MSGSVDRYGGLPAEWQLHISLIASINKLPFAVVNRVNWVSLLTALNHDWLCFKYKIQVNPGVWETLGHLLYLEDSWRFGRLFLNRFGKLIRFTINHLLFLFSNLDIFLVRNFTVFSCRPNSSRNVCIICIDDFYLVWSCDAWNMLLCLLFAWS